MDQHPVIIVRKRRHEHGHHGGAWKVAYADFVTAMMAFFMVMWLTAQNGGVKQAIAGYFRDPGVFDYEHSKGMTEGGKPGVEAGRAARATEPDAMAAEQRTLRDAADTIKKDLMKAPEFAGLRDQIEFTFTSEGLRIELVDRTGSSFFDSGSSVLRGESAQILAVIATEIGRLSNDVVIEGHTDSRQYATSTAFGNWELSADRANAARRVMEPGGLRDGQVRAVRGFADRQLHVADDQFSPRNRRVSIVVRSRAAAALDDAVHATNKPPGVPE